MKPIARTRRDLPQLGHDAPREHREGEDDETADPDRHREDVEHVGGHAHGGPVAGVRVAARAVMVSEIPIASNAAAGVHHRADAARISGGSRNSTRNTGSRGGAARQHARAR